MILVLTIFYEIGCLVVLLLIATLCMAVREASGPVRPLRAVCLLVWSWFIFWLVCARPEQNWLMAYELTVLLLMAVGCAFLWVLSALPPPAPDIIEAAAETPAHEGPKINGKYSAQIEISETILRDKYRRNK